MFQDSAPFLAALVLLTMSILIGQPLVIKLIRVYEGRHDLRAGSAGHIRALSNWAVIAFWLMAVWFVGTVIGDWQASGDLSGALDRSRLRLLVLLEIAAALAESD